MAAAAPVLTTLSDMVYRADGTPAGGSVLVSWPAFAAASGATVPQGSVSVPLTGGMLTVKLVANAGATPIGSYYTAVYHLDDGSISKEYWVIPAAGGAAAAPARLAQVRSQVLPTSVAMQTVSKAYVDTAIAAAASGFPLDSSPYVLKAGDTMLGPLVLPADPVSANQAADKHYVDASVAAVSGASGAVVSTIPMATQVVTQPSGTQLDTNLLNGTVYAQGYVTGRGGNGIANALASADCSAGCDVHVERTYGAENFTAAGLPGTTRIEDVRNGMATETAKDPIGGGQNVAHAIHAVSTQSAASIFQQTGAAVQFSGGLLIQHDGLTGGSNQFPEAAEAIRPYFKSTYSALQVRGSYNTPGQHVLSPLEVDCYGVGDCLIGSQTINSSGGLRDDSDEGAHPFDLQVQEDPRVFAGLCQSGCTTGSTALVVAATAGGGTQGEGRFLIDKNPAKMITGDGTGVGSGGGILTNSGAGLPHPGAYFSGTSFPVSTFFQSTAAMTSQANNLAPGTLTVAIGTSGLPAGYATNTAAAAAASGVACIVDQVPGNIGPTNYEMAQYRVVDGTHLQLINLGKAHAPAATIATGGLCGYGIEQTIDTANGMRQLFPVVGSLSATSIYYAGSTSPLLAFAGSTSGYLNLSRPIAAMSRTNGVVTVTTSGALGVDVNGLTLTVAGATDQSYNGKYVVTTTGANTLTYNAAGANSTTSGGTIGIVTGGFALYPMAEVLGVYDTATSSVDGKLTLGANTVAWAPGDAVEEPHYFQQLVNADTTYVYQTTPRPSTRLGAGVSYNSNNGPGLYGWAVTNAAPASNYLGNGGTHTVPDAAFEVNGAWRLGMSMQAGDEAVFQVGCNSHGCGRWDSGYSLFELQSAASQDTIGWQPQTSGLTMNLRGTQYSFTPQGFTAAAISAGTVTATTLTGAVAGAEVTGTLAAGVLPVFGGSGAGHAQGAVPDPGAAAGVTRFLREDGTFAVPTGGGSSTGAASGDLSGSYPGPIVAAVHAIAGTLDGVTIGGTMPAAASFSAATVGKLQMCTSLTKPSTFGFLNSCSVAGAGGQMGGEWTLSGVADDHLYDFILEPDGLHGRFVNDANTAANDFFVIKRSGLAVTGISLPAPVTAPSMTVGNGFTGTKNAGACTFVIVGGIITNVTGC